VNQTWLQIMAVMVGGSIVKAIISNSFVWVFVDVAVLFISYLILRRYPGVDLKSSMVFLSGLTVVSVLMDLDIVGGLVGNILILALFGWMMFGRNGNNNDSPRRPTIRHKWHK